MNNKVMINIFGPSTAGKSTIAELLRNSIDRLYTVDFDVVKMQISGYHWKRDSEVAQRITFDTLVSVASTGLPILALLPPPKLKQNYDRLASIAENNSYRLLNIEIFAPEDILVKRYEDRLRAVRESGSNWKFKTPDEFKAKLREGYFRPADTVAFDSSVKDPGTIFSEIKELTVKS